MSGPGSLSVLVNKHAAFVPTGWPTHLYEPEMALSPSIRTYFWLSDPRTFCADRVKNSTPPQQRTRRFYTQRTNYLLRGKEKNRFHAKQMKDLVYEKEKWRKGEGICCCSIQPIHLCVYWLYRLEHRFYLCGRMLVWHTLLCVCLWPCDKGVAERHLLSNWSVQKLTGDTKHRSCKCL